MSLTVGFYLQPTAKERFVHEFRVEAITDLIFFTVLRQSDREAAKQECPSKFHTGEFLRRNESRAGVALQHL